MARKKRKSLSGCCMAWKRAVDCIEVTPRDFINPHDRRIAQTLEKLLKYQMGNYCPTCGANLCPLN